MQTRSPLRSSLWLACTLALGLNSATAFAQGHAGGGHAVAGRGGLGGYHGGGYGYGGYRGGGYGWHGGYYGGWGWDGVGLGLYFATLPLYYSTLWWDGIPYYYADHVYYRYDSGVRQYETVAPPPAAQSQASAGESIGTDLIAYPKDGQSAEQQATDKYECHHWAVTQTGFDPTQGAAAASSAGKRSDYVRAQAACLDGRGYTVK